MHFSFSQLWCCTVLLSFLIGFLHLFLERELLLPPLAVPGAPFCGARNTGFNGLSKYDWERDQQLIQNEVDRCCLLHDYCDRSPFDPERKKKSIAIFPGLFIGHCACDHALLECLSEARPTFLAAVVRGIFSLSMCYRRNEARKVTFEPLLWTRPS